MIAIKSGRHEAAAKAAATHTGALSGADRVVDAALRRAGILRVEGLAELFDAAETMARFAPLPRTRVGIVTNGGGAGVLAVDQLVDCEGELAELSEDTIARLNKVLPDTWSHANPVDIIGDAPAERQPGSLRLFLFTHRGHLERAYLLMCRSTRSAAMLPKASSRSAPLSAL